MIVLVTGLLVVPASTSRAEELLDLQARAEVLNQKDGLTEYNDIFIIKRDVRVIADPDELPAGFMQTMMLAAIYPGHLQKGLMIGLGAGSMYNFGRLKVNFRVRGVGGFNSKIRWIS